METSAPTLGRTWIQVPPATRTPRDAMAGNLTVADLTPIFFRMLRISRRAWQARSVEPVIDTAIIVSTCRNQ
ncbi:hypothetical protein NLS1_31630 [Nocardioides sp. LS1]|nr:hypothetical protein NLS1_31630 [Nocardioides sp. LS1]